MANFEIGSVVRNFGLTAKVVGFHQVGIPDHPSNGDPILREINPRTGRLRGGKWVADPAKCEKVGQ